MKKTIRLTESELKNLIRESAKRTLNEYGGWTQDPMEWGVVNTSQDGSDIYKVGLWWGSGYSLDIYMAWANSDEEALNYVVAYITNHHPENIETTDKYAEEAIQDIMKEKGCDRYEAEEYPEFYERFMYVDATMEGATHACYIWSENLTIMKAPEEWKQKLLAREQHSNVSDNEMNESVGRKTIRLTESELKGLISNILNEVKIGGQEFHGDNPVDWEAIRNFRLNQHPRYRKINQAERRDMRNVLDFLPYPRPFKNTEERDKAKEWLKRVSFDGLKKFKKADDNLRHPDSDNMLDDDDNLNEAVTRAIRKYLK